MDPLGETILGGRYELVRAIGKGGMAEVWEAIDRNLGRTVAVKFLRADRPLGETAERRFVREGRALAGLSHPGLVRVYEVASERDALVLVMERVDGLPLTDHLLAGGSLDPAALRLALRVARAVDHAHAAGIVHRDLKPSNILVDRTGHPRVIDFGLAHDLAGQTDLTRSAVVGTPRYMAPEQVAGAAVGPETDVYALGAILYEMTTGRPPHDGQTADAILGSIASGSPPRPRRVRPDLPRDLERIIVRSMARDPSDRHARARALADDLERFLAGEAIAGGPAAWRRRPLLLVAFAGSIVLAAAGLGVAVGLSRQRPEAAPTDRRDEEFDRAAVARLAAEAAQADRRREALRRLEGARRPIDEAIAGLYRTDISIEEVRHLAADGRDRVATVLADAPDLPLAHLLLGRAHELLLASDDAIAAWERALALDAAFGPAHFALGRHLLDRIVLARIANRSAEWGDAAGLAHRARTHLEAAVLHSGALDGDLESRIARTMLAYAIQDYDAIRRLTADRPPDRPGSEHLVLLAAFASRSNEERRDGYDRALAHRPKFAIAVFCRSVESMDGGDVAGAIEGLDLAIRLDPTMSPAWSNRGALLLRIGRLEEARRDLDEAIRLDPEMVSAFVNRSLLAAREGRPAEALADADAALALDPDREDAAINRAIALERLGRVDEAIATYDRILERQPELVLAWANRAALRSQRGEFDRALADYDRAVALDRRDALLRLSRGVVRRQAGQMPGAIEDLEAAVRLAPEGWPHLDTARKQLERARTLLDRGR